MTKLANCLLRQAKDFKNFDESEVVEASKIYQSRGKSEDAANIQAIEDHLDDLRTQRRAIVDHVLEQFKAKEPARYAKIAAANQPVAPAPLTEKDRGLAMVAEGIDELISLLGGKTNMLPEEEARLIPIMSKIFRGAAIAGYATFKDSARWVYNQIHAKSPEVAAKLTIENLQAGYINIAKDIGGDKRAALDFDSIEQLMAAEPKASAAIDEAAHQAATSPLNDKPQPTGGQKAANNYEVGSIPASATAIGMPISIENPQGSIRWKLDTDRLKAVAQSIIDNRHNSAEARKPALAMLDALAEITGADVTKVEGGFDNLQSAIDGLIRSFPVQQEAAQEIFDAGWKNKMQQHYGYIKGVTGADKDHLDIFLAPGADTASKVWVIDQKNPDGSFDEHKVLLGPETEAEARAAYLANYRPGWDGIGAITSMPVPAFKAWAGDGKPKRNPLAYVEPAKTESVQAPEKLGASTEAAPEEAQPSLDDLNSGRAFVDGIKKEIAKWVSSATNNGTRPMDRNWERGAVKRFVEANIKAHLDGKQTGNRAAAKIAVAKSETFADLGAAIEKMVDAPASETEVGAGDTATTEDSTAVAVPAEPEAAADPAELDGDEGWTRTGYIEGNDGISYGVDFRDIKQDGTAYRQIRIQNENTASHMAVWEWRSSRLDIEALDDLRIDLAVFHYVSSHATDEAFGSDATDGDALWNRYGPEILDQIRDAIPSVKTSEKPIQESMPQLPATIEAENGVVVNDAPKRTSFGGHRAWDFGGVLVVGVKNPHAGGLSHFAFHLADGNGGWKRLEAVGDGLDGSYADGPGNPPSRQNIIRHLKERAVPVAESLAPAPSEPSDAGVAPAQDSKAAEHWLHDEIVNMIHFKGRTQNRRALDKIVELLKRRAAGEDIRNGKVKSHVSGFKNEAALTEVLNRIVNRLEAEEKEAADGNETDQAQQGKPQAQEQDAPAGPKLEKLLKGTETAGTPSVKAVADDAELAKLILATAEKGSRMYGVEVANRLYGPNAEAARQTILEALTGAKVPKSRAGHKATMQALYDRFGVQPDAIATMQRELDKKLNAAAGVGPAAAEPAAAGADEAAEPTVDDKGNPIRKVGDRVEITGGQFSGRHGEVTDVTKSRMVAIGLARGVKSEWTTYHYNVRSDNGTELYAGPDQMKTEESRPESVVMDPVVNGRAMEPESLHRSIGYDKQSAQNFRAKAQRARKSSAIAEHKRAAERSDASAVQKQAVWDEWAAKYPAEAEKIAPKPAAPTPQDAATAAAPVDTAGAIKAAGLVVTKTTTKNNKPVWEVSGNTREHSGMLKAMGGRWYGPKKVWSFYNDDPSIAIAGKLGGSTAAPAPQIALFPNEVMLPENPYVYRKESSGGWTWRSGNGNPSPLGAATLIIPQLEAALAAKNPTIVGKPVADMNDGALERIADTETPAGEKARAELEARDAADEPDIGAMFDNAVDELFGDAPIVATPDPWKTVLIKAGTSVRIEDSDYTVRNDYTEGHRNDGEPVSLRTSGQVARVVDKPYEAVGYALRAGELMAEAKAKIKNPTTPEGYAAALANPDILDEYQDEFDAYFQERLLAVRKEMQNLGWIKDDAKLVKNGREARFSFRQIGPGRNIVGMTINDVEDKLTLTPEKFALLADQTAGLTQARQDLDEMQAQHQKQGNFADDRLNGRIERQKKLIEEYKVAIHDLGMEDLAARMAEDDQREARERGDDLSWEPTNVDGLEMHRTSGPVNEWRYKGGKVFAGTEVLAGYPQFYSQALVDSLPKPVVERVRYLTLARMEWYRKEFGVMGSDKTPTAPPPAAGFAVGDRVNADDGRAVMPGVVVGKDGDTYRVKLDGGGERFYGSALLKPGKKDAPKKPVTPQVAAPAGSTPLGAAPTRTAGEAGASAAKNAAMGLKDVAKGLNALFKPKPGTLGMAVLGTPFDEETYAAAKPLFAAGIAHFKQAGADLNEMVKALVKYLMSQSDEPMDRATLEAMKPYVVKFMGDVKDGKVVYDENEEVANNGSERDTDTNAGEGNQGSGDWILGTAGQADQAGMGDQPAANVVAPGDAGVSERPGAGTSDGNVGSVGSVSEGGNAANGRPGTGGNGVVDAGAGGRKPGKRPVGSSDGSDQQGQRPTEGSRAEVANYHIADPEQLIGGTPKVRFARNRKAIEALQAITAEGRPPQQDELDAMAGYIGWGSFGQDLFQGTFDRPKPKAGWEKESDWLREHLGKEAWESAQASIINAHYTDPITVSTMWSMVRQMGFTGGRVLEPSMGVGNFFGLMPRDLMARSILAGIEMDTTTGGMAKLLYPDANIQIKPYQDSKTADGFYDLVIGNWPFAKDGPADRRYLKLSPSLHDFFFLKALDQTRPGGLVVGITSAGTMDKQGSLTRAALAEKADLVAAFRLPTGAFEKYAGTSVVTDIIILKKRETQNADVRNSGWLTTIEVDTPSGNKVKVNQYFARKPGNVLGTLNFGHGTTYGRPAMIVDRPVNLEARMDELAATLPEGVFEPATTKAKTIQYVTNNTKDRQQSIITQGGKLFQVQGEYLAPLHEVYDYRVKDSKKTADREAQLVKLIDLRRKHGALIDADRDGLEDAETRRKALNDAYKAFTKAHGSLGDSEGMAIMRRLGDPFFAPLAALEVGGKPAAILSSATMRTKKKLENPSVRDALIMMRNESVFVDIGRIADLSGVSVDVAAKELTESGAIFLTPDGTFDVSDVYLSGNVRRKLREAEAAAEAGMNMERNIEALRRVVPADIPYFNIEAKLGATWIPVEHYKQFIEHMLGTNSDGIEARFVINRWKVRFTDRQLNNRPEAKTTWGAEGIHFDKLITHAMGNMAVKIWGKDADGNKVINEDLSEKANEKANKIREEFGTWLWSDPARKIEMERAYNESMNAIAISSFDGSFMGFEGMALRRGNSPFDMRSHQGNAVYRGLVNRRGIYAHEVGTGKTYTMGALAVESRRYGIAKKPLIFAHNANSSSVAREIGEQYPGAKLLYIDNLAPDRIDVTLRQIANDEWDAIVVPHSLINRFSLKEETLMEISRHQIEALEQEAIEAANDDGIGLTVEMMNDEDAMKKVRSVTAKQLVHGRNQIIKMIKEMALKSSKEGAVSFEDMGIDMVIVDEAHEFKKPPLATRMSMKGLNKTASAQSISLMLLTDYVKKLNGGTGVHVFTGTPITNTMNEIYNMMRFVMDDQMSRDGIREWDAWFNTFADQTSDVELTPAGEYEPVSRLAAFVNVPELRRMAGQYMDIVFADDMPEFKPRVTKSGKTLTSENLTDAERDELLNGRTENPIGRPYKKVINDVGEMSPEQVAIFDELKQRAASFKAASKKERKEIMLSGDNRNPVIVETAAANAGLDARLYDIEASDSPENKVNRVAKNVVAHYKEHDQATQVIFVDKGYTSESVSRKKDRATGQVTVVKKPRFNLVRDIVAKLTEQGIPLNQIAIVDGGVSKEKRKEIADAMNLSKIRVVIGLTDTLGVGVNMQANLRAMHHLDAPWMPGELEQRNGRGHRQGNAWNTVLEYRYITERIDGRRWQVLSIKDRFIKQFLKADDSIRVIEGDAVSLDEDGDLGNTLSDAAGDPRLLMINKLRSDVQKLENRERMHAQGIFDARRAIVSLGEKIKRVGKALEAYRKDFEKFKAVAKDDLVIEVAGRRFTDVEKANEVMELVASKVAVNADPIEIAKLWGFLITAAQPVSWRGIEYQINGAAMHQMGKPTIESARATMYGIAKRVEGMEADIAEWEGSIPRMEESAKAPFSRSKDLEKKRKMLADTESDIQRNPVPAPSWLRNGAPSGTEAFVDGKPLVIEGHRYTNEGYFVTVSDGDMTRDVPYMEVMDENGLPKYEEHTFVAPKIIKAEDKGVKDGLGRTQTPLEPGWYRVTDDKGVKEATDRNLTADQIKELVGHGYKLQRARTIDVSKYHFRSFSRYGTPTIEVVENVSTVEIEGLPDHKFYAFKDGKEWRVIEDSTGVSLGRADTKKGAIDAANGAVQNNGADKVLARIAELKLTEQQMRDAVNAFKDKENKAGGIAEPATTGAGEFQSPTVANRFDSAKEAVTWLAANMDGDGYRSIAGKILPFLRDVPIHYVKGGDTVPSMVLASFQNGATAVAYQTENISDGEDAIYILEGKGDTEEGLLHEALHIATSRRLVDSAARAEFDTIARAVRSSLHDAGARSSDPNFKKSVDFFRGQFRSASELIAYGFSSPEFNGLLKLMAADGRFYTDYRTPDQLAKVNKNAAYQKQKPVAVPEYSMWHRFIDAVRALFGGEKAYQKAYEQAITANRAIAGNNELASRVEFKTLEEKLNSLLDALLKTQELSLSQTETALPGRVDQLSAYHGTPHNVDKFSTDKIGTGEGAQSFGWGLYFSSAKDIAKWYRDKLSHRSFNGTRLENLPWFYDAIARKVDQGESFADAKEDVVAILKSQIETHRYDLANKKSWASPEKISQTEASLAAIDALTKESYRKESGRLYSVELAPEPDEYLLWDKPLSQQSELVKKALESFLEERRSDQMDLLAKTFGEAAAKREIDLSEKELTGETIYNWIADHPTVKRAPGDRSASLFLHSIGIRGIKYLDGSSRHQTSEDWKVKSPSGLVHRFSSQRAVDNYVKGREGYEITPPATEYNFVIFDENDVTITGMESRGPADFTGYTADEIRDGLVADFGNQTIRQLEENGLLNVMENAEAFKALFPGVAVSNTAKAVFIKDRAYFFANRMRPQSARIELLHEIGEHYGLERLLGSNGYSNLIQSVNDMRANGDIHAARAWDFVATHYPEEAEGSRRFMHEVLAQLGQNADIQSRPWWKQMLEMVKRALVRMGFTGMIRVSDIQDMVLHSLKVAAKPKPQGPGGGIRGSQIANTAMAKLGPDNAAWTEQRIDSLMGKYAYTQDDSKTKAFAAWIDPLDFLMMTSDGADYARIGREAGPLDVDRLRAEDQELFLEVNDIEAATIPVAGHEGRHRAMALMHAGIRQMPVVIYLRNGAIKSAAPVKRLFLNSQRFGPDSRGMGGGFVTGLVPISYEYRDELINQFGSGSVQFSQKGDWYYSALATAVPGMAKIADKAGMIGPKQAKDWLLARQKEGKFKADELNWSGLLDYLDMQAEKPVFERGFGVIEEYRNKDGSWEQVDDFGHYYRTKAEAEKRMGEIMPYPAELDIESRRAVKEFPQVDLGARGGKIAVDDVLRFVRENGVEVQEVVLGSGTDSILAADVPVDERIEILTDRLENLGYEIRFGEDEEFVGITKRSTGGEYDATDSWGDDEAENLLEQLSTAYADKEGGIIIGGGRADFDAESQPTKFSGYQLPGGENYRELLLTLPRAKPQTVQQGRDGGWMVQERDGSEPIYGDTREQAMARYEQSRPSGTGSNFTSSHFDQPNILAHVRFNERHDANGKRVLFIEEIQSDYGQAGRKRGFKGAPESAEIKALRALRLQAISEMEQAGIASDKGFAAANRLTALNAKLKELSGSIEGAIPSAPFVTDTKSWTALALKRMIAYAVENGFDSVAWTTGEQQAARYDLSKQISRISYAKVADDYFVQAVGNNGQVVFDSVRKENELEDVVGKEVAQKIINGEGASNRSMLWPEWNGPHKNLSGLDLKVGGEGMKGFYDEIVPQVAKKLGVEVSIVSIEMPTDDTIDFNSDITESAPRVFAQPGFVITDKMREQVGAGLPLFSKRSNALRWDGRNFIGGDVSLIKTAEIESATVFSVLDASGQPIGAVSLYVLDGKITGLTDIQAFDKKRGTGSRIVDSILDSTDGNVYIENMIPKAVGFWVRMGVQLDEGYSKTWNHGNGFLSAEGRRQAIESGRTEASAGIAREDGTRGVGSTQAEVPNLDLDSPLESRGNYLDTDGVADTLSNFPRRLKSAISSGPTEHTFNKWWHTTVGTMSHLASINKPFARVFNSVQDFLDDSAAFSKRAEEKAPGLIPTGFFAKPLDPDDSAAISDPIFKATLHKHVLTDDEMRAGRFLISDPEEISMPPEWVEFGALNDTQIDYVHQFRAAINHSLEDATRADLLRMARRALPKEMADIAFAETQTAAEFVARVEEAAADRATITGEDNLLDEWRDSSNALMAKLEKLRSEGYAPLMRFGEYTLYFYQADENGAKKPIYFTMFDSESERNTAEAELLAQVEEEFGEVEVERNIRKEMASPMFEGMTPEMVESFAKALGVEQDAVYQEFLKKATNNRSTLRRLIHRKGTAGYSNDVTRVLASFVVSNARRSSAAIHMTEARENLEEIERGDVFNVAKDLVNYVQNPTEEAGALRGFMFFNFLGGSLASAMVNYTQVALQVTPYLYQFAKTGAVKEVAKALKLATQIIYADVRHQPMPSMGRELTAALKQAEQEGITQPNEIHQLMAEARGGTWSRAGGRKAAKLLGKNEAVWGAKAEWTMQRLMRGWGSFFGIAEQSNRLTAFIAAHNIATQQGMGEQTAYEFAKKAVTETASIYNKGNRPTWARGPVGATIFTFKQFSIQYLEFMRRLYKNDKEAFAVGVGMLILMAGATGLPGSDDLDDILDTIGQWMGYPANTKRWRRKHVELVFGKAGADFVLNGVSAILPIDVHARLGLGNIIPGTGMLNPARQDKEREVLEVIGPFGGLVLNYLNASKLAVQGKTYKAVETAAPSAIANLSKGVRMAVTGHAEDRQGKRIADASKFEAFMKGIGIQPDAVSDVYKLRGEMETDKAIMRNMKSALSDQWADGIAHQDAEATQDALKKLREWNALYPDYRITIRPGDVFRKARELKTSAKERYLKYSPKDLRERFTEDLATE